MMNAKLPQSEETFLPTQTLAGNTTGRVLKPAAFVDPFWPTNSKKSLDTYSMSGKVSITKQVYFSLALSLHNANNRLQL